MFVDVELCEKHGIDPKAVRSIARRISKAAKEADALGITVFGGSGSGSLRLRGAEKQGPGESEVAWLEGDFDGGDGGDVYS
jgi:hypothetical protein